MAIDSLGSVQEIELKYNSLSWFQEVTLRVTQDSVVMMNSREDYPDVEVSLSAEQWKELRRVTQLAAECSDYRSKQPYLDGLILDVKTTMAQNTHWLSLVNPDEQAPKKIQDLAERLCHLLDHASKLRPAKWAEIERAKWRVSPEEEEKREAERQELRRAHKKKVAEAKRRVREFEQGADVMCPHCNTSGRNFTVRSPTEPYFVCLTCKRSFDP